MIDDKTLDEIEARANAATPGPWMYNARTYYAVHTQGIGLKDGKGIADIATHGLEDNDNDGRFIAHAREDVPALVAEVRRLRALLAEVRRLMPYIYETSSLPPATDYEINLEKIAKLVEYVPAKDGDE